MSGTTRIATLTFALSIAASGGCAAHAVLPPPLLPLSATPEQAFRDAPPATPPLPRFTMPAITRVTLDNGLTVLVMEQHDLPLVAIRYVSCAAAADGPPGEAGLAALGTQVVLRTAESSADVPEGELPLDDQAMTTRSGSSIAMRVVPEELPAALSRIASALTDPAAASRDLRSARTELLRAIHGEAVSQGALARNRALLRLWGEGMPAGRSPWGRDATVRTFTPAEVRAYVRARFVPAASALVIVGDVHRARVLALVRARFGGGWGAQPATGPALDASAPSRLAAPQSLPSAYRPVDVLNMASGQALIVLPFRAPARTAPDFPAFAVMNALLGEMFTSRLNMSLREARGWSYRAASELETRRDGGTLLLTAAVDPKHAADAARLMLAQAQKLALGGPTAAELVRARTFEQTHLSASLEGDDEAARTLADLFAEGLGPDAPARLARAIEQVRAADVQRAARTYLRVARTPVVIAGDAEVIAPELSRAPLGPVTVVSLPGPRS